MRRDVVLSLCDRSLAMVEPWAAAGYRCIAVDVRGQARKMKNVTCVRADVLTWLPPRAHYKIVFGFPPCTHTAVSGARYFREKGLYGLSRSFAVLERCARIAEWSGAPWMVEHPVSVVSSYWRKPDAYFNPADYAGYLEDDPMREAYTKKTCLWTGRGFVVPEPWPRAAVHGSKMWKLPPSADRQDLRSRTPLGFATAVFEANR